MLKLSSRKGYIFNNVIIEAFKRENIQST